MNEITAWLEKLGLSKYATTFAENDIEHNVLPHLTDQDLKDLGLSLGHWRKLLAAIADLNTSALRTRTSRTVTRAPPGILGSGAGAGICSVYYP